MTRFRAFLQSLVILLLLLSFAVGVAFVGLFVVYLLIESLAAPVQVVVLLSCIGAIAVFVYLTLQRAKQLEPGAARHLALTIGALLASIVLFGVACGILNETHAGLFSLSTTCDCEQPVYREFMQFAFEQFAKSATGDLCESFNWCTWSCISHHDSMIAKLLVFCYRTFVWSSTLLALLLLFRHRDAVLDYLLR